MEQDKIILQKNGTKVTFLSSGDLYEIQKDEFMVNQLNGNPLDGSINQIYLRVHHGDRVDAVSMTGSNSSGQLFVQEEQLTWEGEFSGFYYQVAFKLAENGMWFWRVLVRGGVGTFDIIYGQDIGNALKGTIQANEAYMSQYLDHHVSRVSGGYIISSRQNQMQNGKFPLVEQGCLSPTAGFSTDGYQFFGTSYKETNIPEALLKKNLDNEVYQYEFAYIALQTELFEVTGDDEVSVVFYGAAMNDRKKAVDKPVFSHESVKECFQSLKFTQKMGKGKSFQKNLGEPVRGIGFSKEELDELFPRQSQVEKEGETVLSFFTDHYHHVVLKEKESAMERAHGHIILSGTDLTVDKPLMSSTLYMYGMFNSQLVLGNTTMNKLMSNSRNSLNLLKLSGQRIYMQDNGIWRVLTMPSAFEIALNSAAWYYKTEEDLLKITTFGVGENREIRTEITSLKGRSYTWAVTNHIVMGDDEDKRDYRLSKQGNVIKIIPGLHSPIHSAYPDLTYYLTADREYQQTDERIFGIETGEPVLPTLVFENTDRFTLVIQGSMIGKEFQKGESSAIREDRTFVKFINSLIQEFSLEHETQKVSDMNLLVRWYTHNMLVHYLSPHGLEQYGGAAWGTRDVSQGPCEFFLAVNRPQAVASIIKKVFENQYEDDGSWPQWFMFDRYETIKSPESHGDVIVWPMKVVADYLEKTGDYGILSEKIPYTDRLAFKKTEKEETLLQHIKKEIAYIENNFLEGTYLSCYGDGDWDDTLQPHDGKMKRFMASSWTVALTYQVIKKLSGVFMQEEPGYAGDLERLAGSIRQDYERYMLGTDTLPGFVYMEEPGNPELMIHPQDKKTGIQYRLLPMTRSMIAQLLTARQAQHHYSLIQEYLQFPDGVRLMNRPAHYAGGVSSNFKRAEQSANFGREVGLQYVHAHIRFAEAMAKLGKAEETWKALKIINPIGMKELVPNARLRQSNAYFSSSDGDFKTRYEAQEQFGRLRDGSVDVKGGWRIYSSGPGIYISQLITNVLGIRERVDSVTFDPVLPKELDGLLLTYRILGQPVKIRYHLNSGERKVSAGGSPLPVRTEENRYRCGGMVVERADLEHALKTGEQIEIYC